MKTEISLNKLRNVAEELKACQQQIRRSQEELHDVSSVLGHMEDEALLEVAGKLQRYQGDLEQLSKVTGTMKNVLVQAAGQYQSCENDLLHLMEGGYHDIQIKRNCRYNSLKQFIDVVEEMNLRFKI